MRELVVYVHGRGGSAEECEHYRPLFSGREILGLDYRGATPWEAGREIREAIERLRMEYEDITLIANSLGSYFSLHAGIDALIRKACFISPVVDMERLIRGMMNRAQVTEAELKARGVIPTAFGEELSWEYLRWVREHPIRWEAPTAILYGGHDELTDRETMAAFAGAHNARLTVMEEGEHWFHTEEQLRFLDAWILREKNEE